jgi:hypothetical protein
VEVEEKLSDELEGWLRAEEPKTLGSLIELFGERSFAVIFILLMAVPALPLPTGGVTHVFELIVMLAALQLLAGRRHVWLPERWKRRDISSTAQSRFTARLLRTIRWLEGHSRMRLEFLVANRISRMIYGLVVLGLTLTAFLAPPFSGLDTLPALGVVVLSVAVLVGDSLLALAGLVIGAVGVILVIVLGQAAYRGVSGLF